VSASTSRDPSIGAWPYRRLHRRQAQPRPPLAPGHQCRPGRRRARHWPPPPPALGQPVSGSCSPHAAGIKPRYQTLLEVRTEQAAQPAKASNKPEWGTTFFPVADLGTVSRAPPRPGLAFDSPSVACWSQPMASLLPRESAGTCKPNRARQGVALGGGGIRGPYDPGSREAELARN